MPKIDTIPVGASYGRLTILNEAVTHKGVRMINCSCSCGLETVVAWQNVKAERTSSCGCLQQEARTTHGESNSTLYSRWEGIKNRCLNPSSPLYRYYGGRGIIMHTDWANSYEAFRDWANASGFKSELTIERRDTDLGYNPDNCYWAGRDVQQANRRKLTNTKHQYIGVRQIRNGSWTAAICIKGKQIHIGLYPSEDAAVDARDDYINHHNLPHTLNRKSS